MAFFVVLHEAQPAWSGVEKLYWPRSSIYESPSHVLVAVQRPNLTGTTGMSLLLFAGDK